jgi:hypothetical protein
MTTALILALATYTCIWPIDKVLLAFGYSSATTMRLLEAAMGIGMSFALGGGGEPHVLVIRGLAVAALARLLDVLVNLGIVLGDSAMISVINRRKR